MHFFHNSYRILKKTCKIMHSSEGILQDLTKIKILQFDQLADFFLSILPSHSERNHFLFNVKMVSWTRRRQFWQPRGNVFFAPTPKVFHSSRKKNLWVQNFFFQKFDFSQNVHLDKWNVVLTTLHSKLCKTQ